MKVKVTMSLDENILSLLDDYAKQYGCNRSAAVGFILKNYIDEKNMVSIMPSMIRHVESCQSVRNEDVRNEDEEHASIQPRGSDF